jgi:ABC-type transport system involved in multi-copper enzyme maturation permease subunit
MRRELRQVLWRALAAFFVLEVLLVPAVLFWPNFAEHMPLLRAMAPLKVLQDQLGHIEQTGVVGYVIAQHFFKACSTLGALMAVLFAAGAVAGESLRGTFEIWLARPLSRRRLLLERYALGALALALPVFASTLTVPLLVERVDEHVELVPLLWCAAHQVIFLLAIYSLTFLASTLGRNPWPIATSMLFFTTVEFAVYMVETVTKWSLFRWSDVKRYLWTYEHASLDWRLCAPLLGFSAVCLALSLIAFARRGP